MNLFRGSTITLADRLSAEGGHPYGFDYLRLVLATSVVALHSFVTTHDLADDHDLWRSPLRAVLRLILPMFFALSGFLVAGSLFRSATLAEFAILRLLRIAPALMVEIALSALILGPIVTEYSLAEYFKDRQFFVYFLNSVGDIHFTLPGVFLHNPRPRLVNGSLWTIPFEALCYVVLAALALAGIVRRRAVFTTAVAIAIVGLTLKLLPAGGVTLAPPGAFLVFSFLAGIAFFLYRDRVKWDVRLFVLAVIGSLALLYCDRLVPLAIAPLAYATVYLGVTRPRKTVLLRGDYSYGIYLFAYPIQQTYVLLFPLHRSGIFCFLLAFPVSVAYAMFSWHCIEKPILRKKKQLATLLHRAGRLRNGNSPAK
jgi:peptidoglycan/LPS O-acetylase OafA/YrhL